MVDCMNMVFPVGPVYRQCQTTIGHEIADGHPGIRDVLHKVMEVGHSRGCEIPVEMLLGKLQLECRFGNLALVSGALYGVRCRSQLAVEVLQPLPAFPEVVPLGGIPPICPAHLL